MTGSRPIQGHYPPSYEFGGSAEIGKELILLRAEEDFANRHHSLTSCSKV
jgi:hypothetical protein